MCLRGLCLVALKTVSSLCIKLQFFTLFPEEEAIQLTKDFVGNEREKYNLELSSREVNTYLLLRGSNH